MIQPEQMWTDVVWFQCVKKMEVHKSSWRSSLSSCWFLKRKYHLIPDNCPILLKIQLFRSDPFNCSSSSLLFVWTSFFFNSPSDVVPVSKQAAVVRLFLWTRNLHNNMNLRKEKQKFLFFLQLSVWFQNEEEEPASFTVFNLIFYDVTDILSVLKLALIF